MSLYLYNFEGLQKKKLDEKMFLVIYAFKNVGY